MMNFNNAAGREAGEALSQFSRRRSGVFTFQLKPCVDATFKKLWGDSRARRRRRRFQYTVCQPVF